MMKVSSVCRRVEGGVPAASSALGGGLPEAIPPPPPPPLVRRGPSAREVSFKCPRSFIGSSRTIRPLAVQAHLEGVVILEAVMDERCKVSDVKVLRSAECF